MDAVSCGYHVDLMREVNSSNSGVYVIVEREPVFTVPAFKSSLGLVRFLSRRHREALDVINKAIVATGGAKLPW